MAWKDIREDHIRCPHCQKPIFLKVESKAKVAVREPFKLGKPPQPRP